MKSKGQVNVTQLLVYLYETEVNKICSVIGDQMKVRSINYIHDEYVDERFL
jgi:hypothetical protein